MQVENILNKRVVLRGIEAVRLVMRQPGSLHRAALRQIPRIAEQVKFCRTEGEQQHAREAQRLPAARKTDAVEDATVVEGDQSAPAKAAKKPAAKAAPAAKPARAAKAAAPKVAKKTNVGKKM